MTDFVRPGLRDRFAQGRCRPERHYFPPFKESDDLGGGAQRCECGEVLIDRSLGGGRVVEIDLLRSGMVMRRA